MYNPVSGSSGNILSRRKNDARQDVELPIAPSSSVSGVGSSVLQRKDNRSSVKAKPLTLSHGTGPSVLPRETPIERTLPSSVFGTGTSVLHHHRQPSTVDPAQVQRPLDQSRRTQTRSETESGINEISVQIGDLALSAGGDPASHRNPNALSPEIVYCRRLIDESAYYQSTNGRVIAMADWDQLGRSLKSTYCIISAFAIVNEHGETSQMLQCSCKDALKRQHHLENMKNEGVAASRTLQHERRKYCIHAQMISRLRLEVRSEPSRDDRPDHELGEEGNEEIFEQIQTEPSMMWLVKDACTGSFGVIKRSRNGQSVACLVCDKNRCVHTTYFATNLEHHGFERLPDDFDPLELIKTISRKPIPMDGYILRQHAFPVKVPLIPATESGVCEHGYRWSSNCPVTEGWIASKRCKIFNADGIEYDADSIYYRRTDGPCDCKLYPDGSEYGLLNINNSALVEYSLLFRYVSFYSRNGLTLKGFYDNILEYNKWCGKAEGTISYDRLYTTWNAFVTLAKTEEDHFICRICKRYPETVILDGTALCCAKRRLPSSNTDLERLPILTGTDQLERVFVRQAKARKLLMRFATGKLGGKKAQLDRIEMTDLLHRLSTDRPEDNPLHELVLEISANGEVLEAPDHYKKLLRELSKNTPVCAALQVGSDEGAIDILRQVAAGFIDIGYSSVIIAIGQTGGIQ